MMTDKNRDLMIRSLTQHGVTVHDKQKFTNIIRNYGYNEVVSQYIGLFANKIKTKQGVDFQDIFDRYQLDQQLKNVVMISLQLFEQTFKVALTNALNDQSNSEGITHLFHESYQLQDGHIIRRGDLQARIRHIKKNYTEPFVGYRMQHHGEITPWVLIKELSFGVATNAFWLLDHKMQADILMQLFDHPTTNRQFEKFLNDLKIFRGRAAHNYRLLDFKCNHEFLYVTVLHDLSLLNNCDPHQFILQYFPSILAHYQAKHSGPVSSGLDQLLS